jgi:hypothetical protein
MLLHFPVKKLCLTCYVFVGLDVDKINTTRRNIPITVQRRFDVYKDVGA